MKFIFLKGGVNMVITIPVLSQHIQYLNQGYVDFSQVELNSRADLVRFFGYSVEDAIKLPEDQVYNVIENDGGNIEEGYSNDYGLKCNTCNESVRMDYTDSPSDGYHLICKNEHYGFISVYATDAIDEKRYFEKQVSDEVKKLLSTHNLRSTDVDKESLQNDGELIQVIEMYNYHAFYYYKDKYFYIRDHSFYELVPKD